MGVSEQPDTELRDQCPPESGAPQPRRGRPKGSKNTRTRLGNEFLRSLGPKAKKRLSELLTGADADLAYKAAVTVLEYTYGRPVQATEISGADGAAIETRNVNLSATAAEAVKALRANPADSIAALGDKASAVLSGLNFLVGQAEAREQAATAATGRANGSKPAEATGKANGAVAPANGKAEADPDPIDFGDGLVASATGPDATNKGPGHVWRLARDGKVLREFRAVVAGDAGRRIGQWVEGKRKEGGL